MSDWAWPDWPDVKWDEQDKPVVIAGGQSHPLKSLTQPLVTPSAHVIGINEKTFPVLCERVQTESLHFYEMRVAKLDLLVQAFPQLKHFSIRWNTKVVDIEPLASLGALETLVLEDTPKVVDVTPLASLRRLRGLAYSGGIWNKNRAKTLEPLGDLDELEDLHLLNLRVDEGGLLPIARCAGLRRLELSNQFETSDYAFLSVHLPEVTCEMLAPYIRLRSKISDKDVMVVGKRKPFLNSKTDGEKLAKYEARFQKMQADFAAEAE